jgi:hypothetical protein
VFTHVVAGIVAGIVASVIHFGFGDSLSPVVEFLLIFLLSAPVYVFTFYKLRTFMS